MTWQRNTFRWGLMGTKSHTAKRSQKAESSVAWKRVIVSGKSAVIESYARN